MKVICFLFKILAYLWGFAAETDLCNVICRNTHCLHQAGHSRRRGRAMVTSQLKGRPGLDVCESSTPSITQPGSVKPVLKLKLVRSGRMHLQNQGGHDAPALHQTGGGGSGPQSGPSAWFSHDHKYGTSPRSSCYSVMLHFFSLRSVWNVNTFLSENEWQ